MEVRHNVENEPTSAPGTLLLMVAGIALIGMQSAGYCDLHFSKEIRPWYASKPPTMTRASIEKAVHGSARRQSVQSNATGWIGPVG